MSSLLHPFFLSDRALRRALRLAGKDLTGILVDVGCGARPYEPIFASARYVGGEVLQASSVGSRKCPDFWFDGQRLPFADGTIDGLLCTQVLEHVFEPDAFLGELSRVVRPGGHLLISVPFVWDEHEQPYDFARYSSFGLAHLAEKHGFSVESAQRTLPDASIFLQLWLAYWYKVVRNWPGFLRKALVVAMAVPANVIGLVLARLLPSSPDLYLDNVMLWRKL
jgi:SAM-dependent methyltransferase